MGDQRELRDALERTQARLKAAEAEVAEVRAKEHQLSVQRSRADDEAEVLRTQVAEAERRLALVQQDLVETRAREVELVNRPLAAPGPAEPKSSSGGGWMALLGLAAAGVGTYGGDGDGPKFLVVLGIGMTAPWVLDKFLARFGR